jgi:mono/diheme cytochrome c family protein
MKLTPARSYDFLFDPYKKAGLLMHKLIQNNPIFLTGLIAALFAGGLYTSDATGAGMKECMGGDKPYTVKKGHLVDSDTYNGERRFEGTCMRCHGGQGVGSTLAPALTTENGRLQGMEFPTFHAVVMNGFKGQVGLMPAFGNDPNVKPYICDIWAYLQAIKDGAITGDIEEIGDASKKYKGWE